MYEDFHWQQVPQRHQTLVRQATELYVDWLNGMCADDISKGHMPAYTTGNFLDTEVNTYADVVVLFCRETLGGYSGQTYMELSMGDGDDGGPATLFVHAERGYHKQPTGNIIHAVRDDWYDPDTGKQLPADQPRKVPFEYEQTTLVWDDTYEIKGMMQEFDTSFSFVLDAAGVWRRP